MHYASHAPIGYSTYRLLNHCYTGELRIDANNVQNLLSAAHFLDILVVLNACCIFMEEQMDASSCLMVLAMADLYGCISLAEKAKLMALANFCAVTQSPEFLDLCQKNVQALNQFECYYKCRIVVSFIFKGD